MKEEYLKTSHPDIDTRASRRLTRMYVTALTAVAILTISGQFLIQRTISRQQQDSHIVNVAGKQRYLSQSISKVALRLLSSETTYQDSLFRNQLSELKNLWTQQHYGLQNGDSALNLPPSESRQLNRMFSELEPVFQKLSVSTDSLIAGSGDKRRHVTNILNHEDDFLRQMDLIVHQFESEASKKVTSLKAAEWILMGITLFILLIEGFFIFRPAANKIKDTIHELMDSEKKASSLAKKLKITNISLNKSVKDLKDLTFALEHATILAKTDRYGIITYANDKFCHILKYKRSELLGERYHIISSHYHSKSFFDQMWETISQGKVWNGEIKNRAKNGEEVWMDTTIVPVLDSTGAPESYIGIYADVSQKFRQRMIEQKIRSASVVEGQEKERRKIARELHDGLGQMLTALKFNLQGVKGRNSKTEQKILHDLKTAMSETIQEVRRISFNLMPTVLSDYGLIPAVKNLTGTISKVSGINFNVNIDYSPDRMPKNVEVNLYRIVQEAVNNAIKYSEATDITISFTKWNNQLVISISDNGIGIRDMSKKKKDYRGNGISNIQERTSMVNGDFSIETAPGEGTKITIRVPITTESSVV